VRNTYGEVSGENYVSILGENVLSQHLWDDDEHKYLW
jgi:hypothetical protein